MPKLPRLRRRQVLAAGASASLVSPFAIGRARGPPGRIVADWALQRECTAFDFPRDRGHGDFQRFRRRLIEALVVTTSENASPPSRTAP